MRRYIMYDLLLCVSVALLLLATLYFNTPDAFTLVCDQCSAHYVSLSKGPYCSEVCEVNHAIDVWTHNYTTSEYEEHDPFEGEDLSLCQVCKDPLPEGISYTDWRDTGLCLRCSPTPCVVPS
jgi:hypothetical protein